MRFRASLTQNFCLSSTSVQKTHFFFIFTKKLYSSFFTVDAEAFLLVSFKKEKPLVKTPHILE